MIQQLVQSGQGVSVQTVQNGEKERPVLDKGQKLVGDDQKALCPGLQSTGQHHIFLRALMEQPRAGFLRFKKDRHLAFHQTEETARHAGLLTGVV